VRPGLGLSTESKGTAAHSAAVAKQRMQILTLLILQSLPEEFDYPAPKFSVPIHDLASSFRFFL
jgi:hypothetical protein